MKTPIELAKDYSKQFAHQVSAEGLQNIETDFIEGYEAGKPKWISVKDEPPEPNKEILVLLDYTEYNRGKSVKIATTHFTDKYIGYGGPMALTGSGKLKGLYYALPAIIHPKTVTHWMPLPEVL